MAARGTQPRPFKCWQTQRPLPVILSGVLGLGTLPAPLGMVLLSKVWTLLSESVTCAALPLPASQGIWSRQAGACTPGDSRQGWVRSLGWEDPLEKGKAIHSSILVWRIP